MNYITKSPKRERENPNSAGFLFLLQFHPPWSILVAYCLIHRDLNILPESKDVDNFMNFIDLHVHSTCSDGTYTPTQLVEYAAQKDCLRLHLQTMTAYPESRRR